MIKPVRLQLSRRKGFNLQAHSKAVNGLPAVNCARPSKWGNPYKVGDNPYGDRRRKPLTAEQAVALYKKRECHTYRGGEIVRELRGKNLACWCALGAPCHADVLLEIANRVPEAVDD